MMLLAGLSLLLLIPATLAAGYYLLFTTIGWLRRRRAAESCPGRTHFALVIPAHNEERSLPATMQSIAATDYPKEKITVLVVADNCRDATASVARSLGADCLERVDEVQRGKGYALAAGIPLALESNAEVVLIVDADTVLLPDTLREINRAMQSGADVVQTAVSPREPESVSTGLIASVGAILENAVSAGRSALGGSPDLRGTGMAFRRCILERYPWTAFGVVEDAEYAARLTSAGVRIHFVPSAEVLNDPAPDVDALLTQRRRWRTSLFQGTTRELWHRWLSSKPIVLAQLFATTVTVIGITPWLETPLAIAFASWLLQVWMITAIVYLRAIQRVERLRFDWQSLRQSAAILTRLVRVTLGGFWHRPVSWERTPRLIEQNRL